MTVSFFSLQIFHRKKSFYVILSISILKFQLFVNVKIKSLSTSLEAECSDHYI